MPKLIITEESGTREVPLHSGDTLGRIAGNAIQIDVPEASRRHCAFTEEQGTWWIEDLGSSNGTLVNGRRIAKLELQDGDLIQVGVVTLRYLESDVEEASEPDLEWGEDDLSLEEEPYLILHGGGRKGDVVVLPEGRVTVGRKARHQIQIKDISVSGDHAEIINEGGRVIIRDLGSSNGTFVGGRKVREVELQSGDEVRFGAVTATFGVGDPAVAREEAQRALSEGTVAMEMGDLSDSTIFELHDMPKQKEGIWNLLALVVILGLGGGVAFLVTQGGESGLGGAGASLSSPAGNLVPEAAWSFEPPLEEGEDESSSLVWEKSSTESPGEVEEVADPVLAGGAALAVRRPSEEGPPTLAALRKALLVSGGDAYEVRVSVISSETGGIPFVQLSWFEEEPLPGGEVAPITRDRVYGPSGALEWKEFGGVVTAPGRARFAVLGVGLAGMGRAVFDNISVLPAASSPVGGLGAVKGFQPVLGPAGRLRLSRFGRIVLDGVGVCMNRGPDAALVFQDELLVVASAEGGSVVGSLRGGAGDLRVQVSEEAGRIRLVYEGPGLAAAGRVAVPIDADSEDVARVTVLSEKGAGIHEGAFEGEASAEVIIGVFGSDGNDQVKLHLQDEEGQALARPLSLARLEGRPVLFIDTAGLSGLEIGFQLSFETEEEEARALVLEARAAASRKEAGRAIGLCEEAMARFPFVPQAERDARALRERLLEEGRGELKALEREVDDVLFFHTLARADDLLSRLDDLRKRYAGSLLEEPAKALHERLGSAHAAWLAKRQEEGARIAMARARDYMKNGKDALALVFYRYIAEKLSGSAWSDQARLFIQKINERRTRRSEKK